MAEVGGRRHHGSRPWSEWMDVHDGVGQVMYMK